MSPDVFVEIISRLVFGAGSAFLAIILWSRTRDTAWMFIVIAAVFFYGQIIYETFGIFGIVPVDVTLIEGVLNMDTVLEVMPHLFLIVAFIIMIRRSFRR